MIPKIIREDHLHNTDSAELYRFAKASPSNRDYLERLARKARSHPHLSAIVMQQISARCNKSLDIQRA